MPLLEMKPPVVQFVASHFTDSDLLENKTPNKIYETSEGTYVRVTAHIATIFIICRHETEKQEYGLGVVRGILYSTPVVFNLFSPRTPRDTFPLNFVPPKLLVPNSSYT
jgi:hypothetical protein